VSDPANPSLVDKSPHARVNRLESVHHPFHEQHAGLATRISRPEEFLSAEGRWLLDKNVLSGACGKNGIRGMKVMWKRNVDCVNARICQEVVIRAIPTFKPEFCGKRLGSLLASAGNRDEASMAQCSAKEESGNVRRPEYPNPDHGNPFIQLVGERWEYLCFAPSRVVAGEPL